MKKIYLAKNKYAIVDNEDYIYLKRFKWKLNIKKDQHKNKFYYASLPIQRNKKIVYIYMYEFLIKMKNFECIVFKNKNTLDYRKKNLCNGTFSLRTIRAKKRPNLYSKYKGVTYRPKRKLWETRICKNKKTYFLGQFKNEKDAAIAYDKKGKELYGELAYQNII